MWTNAQRDGRPVEYRWRPLFNAAKFDTRILPCFLSLVSRKNGEFQPGLIANFTRTGIQCTRLC